MTWLAAVAVLATNLALGAAAERWSRPIDEIACGALMELVASSRITPSCCRFARL